MKNQNTTLKIVCTVLFGGFAAASTWLTAQSLALMFPQPSKNLWWLCIAIGGIFLLTSYFVKLVIDCFDMNSNIEKRGWTLIGALLGILLFWGLISLPTNTHSLFFTKYADAVAKNELNDVRKELNVLLDPELYMEKYDVQYVKTINEVEEVKQNFQKEAREKRREGIGDNCEQYLNRIEQLLDINTPEKRMVRHNSDKYLRGKALDNAVADYVSKINDAKKNYTYKHLQNVILHLKSLDTNAIKNNITNIDQNIKELNNDKISRYKVLTKSKIVLKNADAILESAYKDLKQTNIKNTNNYSFERMCNPYNVCTDYLTGKNNFPKNQPLLHLILLAVAIDLAAFLFFRIAFK